MKSFSSKNTIIVLSLFSLFLLSPDLVSAQTASTIFQLVDQSQAEIPTIRVETDWKQLIKTKKKEIYQKAQFTYLDGDQKKLELSAKVRSRGNIRKEVCYYPPLKIKFKKKMLHEMGFDTLNKLKFVIQCKRGKIGESYLMREYFIYKLHELVGPITYKTKLIRFEMAHEDGEMEELYGFLIEEEDEFGQRQEGRVFEVGKIRNRLINRDAYLKMVFFQYLILNTDWSMQNKHNLEFIWMDDLGQCIPVPYDFDYSGMVETGYSVPHPSRGIKSVKEPCFLGKDVTEMEALNMADFFLTKKEEMFAALQQFEWTDDKQKQPVEWRMNDFFELIANKKRVLRNFVTIDD